MHSKCISLHYKLLNAVDMNSRIKSYKSETFTAWTELLIQLDYANTIHNDSKLNEIYAIHKEKYVRQRSIQSFTEVVKLNHSDINLGEYLVSKDIYYKWLEVRAFSYNFLQYARSLGGTYGHRVGSLYQFIDNSFNEQEEYLKSFSAFEKERRCDR
jgi:hypothetical protein